MNKTGNLFIEGPKDKYGNTKIVNLENVTNIAFEQYTNRFKKEEWKIIFNYNYGISLRNDYSKHIADYTYFVFQDEDLYQLAVDKLDPLIEAGWLAPMVNNNVSRIVNPKAISFIAQDPSKNRIIVNLATSVSFWNNTSRITSDFIYLDFSSPQEYRENVLYMSGQLNVI